MNYTPVHTHTTYSILDSSLHPEALAKKVKEYGGTALAITEHGNVFNWSKKKLAIEAEGLKYIHGVELYMTKQLLNEEGKKIRDNYHVILLAKNYDGVEEINELVSIANEEDHSYYRPRITFEELSKVSNNVFVLSACLGGVYKYVKEFGIDSFVEPVLERIDYFEVQSHQNDRQKALNRWAIAMAKKYGKRLIYGPDAHEIDEYGSECRDIIMHSKGIRYDDEEGFDIILRPENIVRRELRKQNILNQHEIDECLSSTIEISAQVEEFELDRTFKYPDIYNDENELLMDRVAARYNELVESGYIKDEEAYQERIAEEYEVLTEIGMSSFLLFMGDLTVFCQDNNIEIGYCRGSSGGSLVAFLLGVTDLDPIVWGTTFARFANKERVSLADIDSDFSPSDRLKVFNYILEKSGEGRACYITTFTKLSGKSTIDMICRAKNISLDKAAELKKAYDAAVEEGTEQQLMEANKDVFYYYEGLDGAVVANGIHAAGMISGPSNLRRTMGVRYDKQRKAYVSQLDMKASDFLNYVKYDILSLKTLEVVRDTYRMAGTLMPKSIDINWNDEEVMKTMLDSPVGLFQFESSSAFEYMKKFKPRNVKEIALLSAILRPAAESFRDSVIDREVHTTGDERIDEILIDTYGRLVYQEQQIAFLEKTCGFTAGQADVVRRAIGKKDKKLMDEWLPKIEEGFLANGGDAEVLKEFMTVFIDSCNYSFNYSHAVGYSMMTYMGAYVRHYYNKEFVASYLNNVSNDDDIINGTKLANLLEVTIEKPTFGYSVGKYQVVGDVVYKGIGSVVNVSEGAANNLYEAYPKVKDMDWVDTLEVITGLKDVNKTKIVTLIRIDYFRQYGPAKKLERMFNAFQKYKGKKQLKKATATSVMLKICEKCLAEGLEGFSETPAMIKFDWKVMLKKVWNMLGNKDYTDAEKVVFQLSYLNYVQDNNLKGQKIGQVVYNVGAKRNAFIRFINGTTAWYNIGEHNLKKDDWIEVMTEAETGRGRKVLVSYAEVKLLRNKR